MDIDRSLEGSKKVQDILDEILANLIYRYHLPRDVLVELLSDYNELMLHYFAEKKIFHLN